MTTRLRSPASTWTTRLFRNRLLAVSVLVLGCCIGPGTALPASADPVPVPRSAGWQWPLRPAPDDVIHGFDPPDDPWGSGHRGVDLRGTAGAEVHAAGDGVVTFAGVLAGRGVVTVTTGSLRTTYEPVTPKVGFGDVVRAGGVIATLDLSGGHCLPIACLHWGLLRGTTYLDPLSLVGAGPVRLLPLEQGSSPPVLPVTPPIAGVGATAWASPPAEPGTAGEPRAGPAPRTAVAISVAGGLSLGGLVLAALGHRGRRRRDPG
jgi:murein DD-endopeptidase MepM/ murein hydrolase activator NlpD